MSETAFIITIDTEGDNLWSQPRVITTHNARFLPRFQSLCERFGFRPVYLTNYEMAICDVFVEFGRDVIARRAGEIGMHLHAWNSPPLLPLTDDDWRPAVPDRIPGCGDEGKDQAHDAAAAGALRAADREPSRRAVRLRRPLRRDAPGTGLSGGLLGHARDRLERHAGGPGRDRRHQLQPFSGPALLSAAVRHLRPSAKRTARGTR